MQTTSKFLAFLIIGQLAVALIASEQTAQQLKQPTTQSLPKTYKWSISSAITTVSAFIVSQKLDTLDKDIIRKKINFVIKQNSLLFAQEALTKNLEGYTGDFEKYPFNVQRTISQTEYAIKDFKELSHSMDIKMNRLAKYGMIVPKCKNIVAKSLYPGIFITFGTLGYEGYQHYKTKKK